jgi:hypothetical protein
MHGFRCSLVVANWGYPSAKVVFLLEHAFLATLLMLYHYYTGTSINWYCIPDVCASLPVLLHYCLCSAHAAQHYLQRLAQLLVVKGQGMWPHRITEKARDDGGNPRV